jgi:hypothetical protein
MGCAEYPELRNSEPWLKRGTISEWEEERGPRSRVHPPTNCQISLLDHYEIIVGICVSPILPLINCYCSALECTIQRYPCRIIRKTFKRTFQVAWRSKCDIPAMNYSRAWDQWSVALGKEAGSLGAQVGWTSISAYIVMYEPYAPPRRFQSPGCPIRLSILLLLIKFPFLENI